MTGDWDNRDRVESAGLVARGTAAAVELAVAGTVAYGVLRIPDLALRLVARLTDRSVGISPTNLTVLRVTATCVVGLLAAWWTAGAGGPSRRSVDVRIVDATTYASIGFPRALQRFAVRECIWIGVVLLTLGWAVDHQPTGELRFRLAVVGYVAATRVAPLVLAWFLPRRRGLHDLVAHTVVIDAGPTSADPRVEPVLQSRQTVVATA